VLRRWQDSTFILVNQGDDILLASSGEIDATEWASEWLKYGLKCELLNAIRFLAKHRLPTGAHPVGGRIVQQTIANEHEPVGLHWDPILVLGMQSRWANGPPPALMEVTRAVLKSTSFAARTGVYDGPTADAWLESPTNARALADLLRRLSRDSWIQQLRREAPHSPSAQATLDALVEAGLLKEDPAMETKALALDQLISKTSTWSRRRKVDLARRLWFLVNDNASDEQVILAVHTF
jgi:hypothetical protein